MAIPKKIVSWEILHSIDLHFWSSFVVVLLLSVGNKKLMKTIKNVKIEF